MRNVVIQISGRAIDTREEKMQAKSDGSRI